MKRMSCKRPLVIWNNRHSGLEPHLLPSCIKWPKIKEIKCSSFLILSIHMVFQAQELPPSVSFAKCVLLWTSLESEEAFCSSRFFRRQPRNPFVIFSACVRGLQKRPLGERGTLNKGRGYFWEGFGMEGSSGVERWKVYCCRESLKCSIWKVGEASSVFELLQG